MNLLIFIPLIFFFVAFIFSMIGMGGAQLYVPILFWLGMDLKTQAIPLAMLLNVVNSLSATIIYASKKLVEWRIVLPFALAMILFPPLGTWVNIVLPTKPILMIFALFTIASAILMLSNWKPKRENFSSKDRYVIGFSGGSLLGFFAGLIGRGGGSFVTPLLYITGLEAKTAAATSAFTVTCSGVSSFISHIFTAAQPDWILWILCILSVIIGSQVGSRFMSTKLDSKYVRILFGITLLGVALILIIQTFLM